MTSHERRSDPEALKARGQRTDRPDRGGAPRGRRSGPPRTRRSTENPPRIDRPKYESKRLNPHLLLEFNIVFNLFILCVKLSPRAAFVSRPPSPTMLNSVWEPTSQMQIGGQARGLPFIGTEFNYDIAREA